MGEKILNRWNTDLMQEKAALRKEAQLVQDNFV